MPNIKVVEGEPIYSIEVTKSELELLKTIFSLDMSVPETVNKSGLAFKPAGFCPKQLSALLVQLNKLSSDILKGSK